MSPVDRRSPNPRLQRTRSAAPPSPLSRQPLGRKRFIILKAMVAVLLSQAWSVDVWADGSPAQPDLPITRVDSECGFRISLPRDWWTQVAYPAEPCSLFVGPNSWEETAEASSVRLPDAPIILYVIDASFGETVAKLGMRREKGKWIYRIKSPEEGTEVQEMRGFGWRGLQMQNFSGNHVYKQGGNAGAGFETTVILGTSKKSATFQFDSACIDSEIPLKIVKSIRFLVTRR